MKYSVIIPAYNAEKTICRCVKSIISQPYEDYELIIVNDGSSDNTLSVCKALAGESNKIKLIDISHSGVSVARNKALDEAKGEYVTFVDSDDYVAKNYFSLIDSQLSDYDLLIFAKCTVSENAIHLIDVKPFSAKTADKTIAKVGKLICNKVINSPCTKVYRKNIIENNSVRFPESASMAEDKAFNVKYSLYCSSIKIVNEPLYFYNVSNPSSLTRSKNASSKGTGEYMQEAIEDSDISEKNKNIISKSLDFCNYRSAYHYAKMYARAGLPKGVRLVKLKAICQAISKKKYKYPKSPYCLLICLPVKLGLTRIIDFAGSKLL